MASLALLFALLAPPLPQAQDHAARVERFLAVLPPSGAKNPSDADRAEDEAKATTLIAANPGKEPAIRAAIDERGKCVGDYTSKSAIEMLRQAADGLTDAELDKLIAFYTGPDLAAVKDADEAKAKELQERYPLMRFYEAMQKSVAANIDATFAALSACDTALEASLAKAGVKN